MTDWQIPDWLDERNKEIDESLISYDPAKDILLNPRWDGVYKFRILPVSKKGDWLRQVGHHWNVFPTTDANPVSIVGCPRFTYGLDCPICGAIDKAIAERKNQWSDFTGQKGIICAQRMLIRILLLEFTPSEREKKPPKFTDLPQIKIFSIPARTVGKEIRLASQDEDYGFESLTHPEKGKIIKCTKDDELLGKWKLQILKEFPIPEEFLDPNEWPAIEIGLPKTTGAELEEMIKVHELDVNPILSNYVLGHDVEFTSIPEGLNEGNLPAVPNPSSSRKSSKDKLKERLGK